MSSSELPSQTADLRVMRWGCRSSSMRAEYWTADANRVADPPNHSTTTWKVFFFFSRTAKVAKGGKLRKTHTHTFTFGKPMPESTASMCKDWLQQRKRKKKNWWPIIEWDLRRNGINRAGANRRKKKGIHTIFIHYQIGKAKCQNLGTLLESPPFKQNDKQTGEMLQSSGGV